MIQRFLSKKFSQTMNLVSLPRLVHICAVEKYDTWPRILHNHQNYTEIVFVREGALLVQLDNITYKAQKGDIVVYNVGSLHDERPDPGSEFCSYVCGISDFVIDDWPVNYLPVGNSPVISMDNRATFAEQIFCLILEQVLLDERPSSTEESCQYLLVAIMSSILSAISGNFHEVRSPDFSLGEHIKSYLDTNYSENINLSSISQDLGISPFYLSHVFREETGYSPIRYVINRRLGEAQNLLIQTKMPIHLISQKVGYENAYYFCSIFKKQTGMTPSQFRENMESDYQKLKSR